MKKVYDALRVNVHQTHRLVTHEDGRYLHAHKLLGVSVLGHFAYRLWYWWTHGPDVGLGLDDGSWATLALLMMHLSLHASSFQFALPARRNLAYNVIWPEMRWHSAFFAGRSIVVLLAMWLQRNGVIGEEAAYACRGLSVLLTMVLADVVTHFFKKPGAGGRGANATSSTIRDNPYPAWVPRWCRHVVALTYSTAQVFGTLMVLFRTEGAVFWTLLPIQTAPLLITLVKKGIIAPAGWHLWYSLAILVNYFFHPVYDGDARLMMVGNLVHAAAVIAVLRFGLRVNKYLLWSGVFAWGAVRAGFVPGLVDQVLRITTHGPWIVSHA